jgi:hypothetical protein
MMDFGHPQTTESKILQESVAGSNEISNFSKAYDVADISHKSRINSKYRRARPLPSPMQSAGEARAYGIGRTKSSSMLSNHSIFLSALLVLCCGLRF